MKKTVLCVAVLSFIFLGFGSANALNTYYDNSQIYNNKIPYSAFFNGHSPKPEKIKVQKSVNGKVVQAIVPVNEKEQDVEQKGLED